MRRHGRRDLLLHVQALDEDQEGNTLVLKKLFEEDREFNQGAAHYVLPFAEEFRFHCSYGFFSMHIQQSTTISCHTSLYVPCA
jgi:hypothetical protein